MIKAKHQQLFDILSKEILRKSWSPGEKLPQLKEIAQTYSVSINVASKAVELLKEAGLVNVKVGDGIYVRNDAPQPFEKMQYAGKRIFGQYQDAKTFRLLIEGNTPRQLGFWQKTLEDFTCQNPDIELSVTCCTANEIPEGENFEIILGGWQFNRQVMKKLNITPLPHETAADFLPELYKNALTDDSAFAGLLPYGLNTQCLLALPDTPAPRPGENILDYIEHLPGDPGGYVVRSAHMLLSAMDVAFDKLGTDDFSPADARWMREVFEHARELYRSGRMLWHHGNFTDLPSVFEMLKKRTIRAVETDSGICREFMDEKYNILLPHPSGTHSDLFVYCACINNKTLFPEECLRLVDALLSSKVQKAAANEMIFMPFLKNHASGLFGELDQTFDQGRGRFIPLSHPVYLEFRGHFLGWEFFYFLNGKRGPEVIELLDKKIRYYLKHQKRELK